jgi:hypothetical protein
MEEESEMKSYAIILLFLIVLSVFTVFTSKASAQASGLVGYWKFDEGSGSTASDSSGKDNNGNLSSYQDTLLPQWVNGKNGTALKFDGNNDFVLVPDFSNIYSTVTVMAWVYLPAGAHYGDSSILSKDAANGTPNLDLVIHDDVGHVGFGLGSGGQYTFVTSVGYVPRNVWTHVAATYDGSLIKIYISDNLDSTHSWTSGFNPNNGMPLCIGASNYQGAAGGSSHGFCINGTLDDVRIYNIALSQQDVQTAMNSVPEFPSVMILLLCMVLATTGAVVAKKRFARKLH